MLQHMPRLDVSVHELPARVNSGELHRVVLELYNPSKVPVKVNWVLFTLLSTFFPRLQKDSSFLGEKLFPLCCFPCGEFNTMQYPAMMVRTCRTWIFQKVYCLGEFLCVCNHCQWLKSMTLLLYVVIFCLCSILRLPWTNRWQIESLCSTVGDR